MKKLIVVGLFAFLASCGFSAKDSSENNQVGSGIVGGSLVDERDPLAAGVVAIIDVKEGAICTGSLIGPNLVLTAAHCAYHTKPSNLRIVFGVYVDMVMNSMEPDIVQEYVRTADRIAVHPGYDPNSQNDNENLHDIAIIRFRGQHPVEYTPVQILPQSSMLRVGDQVIVAGYGVSEVTTKDVDAKDIPNIDEALAWGEVICKDDVKKTGCQKVEASGDGELRQANVAVTEIWDSEVVFDQTSGRGSCSGDSGGPAYVEKNGQLYLFGITSRGDVLCNQVGIYTNAAEFSGWIKNSIRDFNND